MWCLIVSIFALFLTLRSGFAALCYDIKCLFCCKTIQEGMFKEESQRSEKHLAYKVKSDSFHQGVKAKCVETKYIWANEVLARIEYSIDLMASTSLYHKCCSIEFRLGKYPEKIVMNHFPRTVKKMYLIKCLTLKRRCLFASCKLFTGK